MKRLKRFNTHSDYEAYMSDATIEQLPNVSCCVDDDHIHFNPECDSVEFFSGAIASYTGKVENVYDSSNKYWSRNNLGQYEEYGKYDGGMDTWYEGKLTIENGKEYEYRNGKWNCLGDVIPATTPTPLSGCNTSTMFSVLYFPVIGEPNASYDFDFSNGRGNVSAHYTSGGTINPRSCRVEWDGEIKLINTLPTQTIGSVQYYVWEFEGGFLDASYDEAIPLAGNTVQYPKIYNKTPWLTHRLKIYGTVLPDGIFGDDTQIYTASSVNAITQAISAFTFSSIVDASGLQMATELATSAYTSMFEGCTSLVTAPELPATTLANDCYNCMFIGCTSLVTAPALPATTLANKCYANMFSGCTSLVAAPELPAATLTERCYYNMFAECAGLTTSPELPAATLASECYYHMFNRCTGLTTAPELPAATLTERCYQSMFLNCTSLVTAPELPATTLANYCYSYMFQGCTSLVTAPALSATELAASAYTYMFSGCTSLVTAPELPATTLANYCYANMFRGCTSLVTAPALPATTLAEKCYQNMFYGCSSLVTAPALPATTLTTYCYDNMFYGCTSLVAAPALPATTLANYCYNSMFNGCTSLVTAPALPATTLATNCYYRMFYGCSKLNYIKCLATNISASSSHASWVNGVASSGTFVKASGIAESTWTRGTSGIPSGWTVVDA